MKTIRFAAAFSALFLSLTLLAKAQTQAPAPDQTKKKASYGAKISTKGAVSVGELPAQMGTQDSMWVRVKGDVQAVCQKKGCWMTLDMGGDQSMRVKFKDYAFFMPLNSPGTTAYLQGWAYRRTIPVDELRHYALDAGKSKEEIEKITEPQVEFIYYADGVVLVKN